MGAYVIQALLERMIEAKASDLYITAGCAPMLRVDNDMLAAGDVPLTEEHITAMLESLLDADLLREFHETMELNTAVHLGQQGRYRVNVFRQQQQTGIVIRLINTLIPTLEELGLPKVFADTILQKRGLILVAGTTGSGKSTSLAAMLGHRNSYGSGHIITIEDPIEFVHSHKQCIITQREIGIDTASYDVALKNALRQRPDVVLIGEIRDRSAMEHALNFAESGHLCVATIHANNANQGIQRIINLFPSDMHAQVLYNLSMNLRAIFSQRLVANTKGSRSLALEVMLNEGLISSHIKDGQIKDIKEVMEMNEGRGMCSFDQSLSALYESGEIEAEVAIAEADNQGNMRIRIQQINELGGGAPKVSALGGGTIGDGRNPAGESGSASARSHFVLPGIQPKN